MRASSNTNRPRNRQRGVSFVLVALALAALLATSALAIDLASLYVARNEAQRAADSAALAGAKVFVETGFVSSGASNNNATNVQALARTRAENVGAQNKVGGQAVTVQDSDVTFNSDFAPSKAIITVLVQRSAARGTAMPTFFAKAFGVKSNDISATASAEAFDPIGGKVGSNAQVGVACLKPLFVPNCDLHHSSPKNNSNCRQSGSANFAGFFNSDGSGSLANPGLCTGAACAVTTPGNSAQASGGIVGETLLFDIKSSTPPAFKILDLGGGSQFTANVTTCNTTPFTCAASGLSQLSGITASQVDSAAETLIHASGDGLNSQDTITVNSSQNPPFTITGGSGNPNSSLRGVSGIATSDSIVTLPVYDNGDTSKIVGFLQVFITQVNKPNSSDVNFTAVIMNAFGCNCGGGGDSHAGNSGDEGGGGGCCGGGGGDSHKGGDSVRGDEGGGGGGCITVQGPGGSPFLIRLINPGGGQGEGGS